MDLIHILSISADDGYSLNNALSDLRHAIDTDLLPHGQSVRELIQSYAEIQNNRSFSPGYDRAGLTLQHNEQSMLIVYRSTGGTEVDISLEMSELDPMEFVNATIDVYLPSYRAKADRTAYEQITSRFKYSEWYGDGFTYREGDIFRCQKILALPVPRWAKDQARTKLPKRALDRRFARWGFAPTSETTWLHQDGRTIVLSPENIRVFFPKHTELITVGWSALRALLAPEPKKRRRAKFEDDDMFADYEAEDDDDMFDYEDDV